MSGARPCVVFVRASDLDGLEIWVALVEHDNTFAEMAAFLFDAVDINPQVAAVINFISCLELHADRASRRGGRGCGRGSGRHCSGGGGRTRHSTPTLRRCHCERPPLHLLRDRRVLASELRTSETHVENASLQELLLLFGPIPHLHRTPARVLRLGACLCLAILQPDQGMHDLRCKGRCAWQKRCLRRHPLTAWARPNELCGII
mmetsp:Transcript_94761/g.238882  ORF Transcript_94761/g.238882 Transcript_94761/m.238882 type:complete len:204 (-) Transcript_94761:774-1385(-)